MKFTFTQDWGSNKAGTTENLPNQLANMLQSQGYGKIDGMKTEAKTVAKQDAQEVPNEAPKSKAKPS